MSYLERTATTSSCKPEVNLLKKDRLHDDPQICKKAEGDDLKVCKIGQSHMINRITSVVKSAPM